MTAGRFTFQAHEHLRRPVDFRRVYDRRRSISNAWLIIYACENDLPHVRLGMSVSKKMGGAPQRNRLRRLYREAFRLTKHLMPTGLDLILIPRQKQEPSLDVLMRTMPQLINDLARRMGGERKCP